MRKSIVSGLVSLVMASPFAARASGKSPFTTVYNVTNGYPTGLSKGDGVLYGANLTPTSGECGSVSELRPPVAGGGEWTEELLYAFATTGGDACNPAYAPIPAPDGSLYGLANLGGAYGNGALYQLQPPASPGGPWTERVLCSLGSGGGPSSFPTSGLVRGPYGSFYVLNSAGANGTLLQLLPPASAGAPWTVSRVYSFPEGREALAPDWLVAGPNGSLYGLSEWGGYTHNQYGTVFQLTPPATPGGAWKQTVLYSFGAGHATGGNPSSLVLARDGTLFGTTQGMNANDGYYGAAVAFQLSPPPIGESKWSYTVLRHFGELHPDSTIVLQDGTLYFAASSFTGGLVFELSPPAAPGGEWSSTVLHRFTNGQNPFSQLVMTQDGSLFGITGAMNVPAQSATGTVYMIRTR